MPKEDKQTDKARQTLIDILVEEIMAASFSMNSFSCMQTYIHTYRQTDIIVVKPQYKCGKNVDARSACYYIYT